MGAVVTMTVTVVDGAAVFDPTEESVDVDGDAVWVSRSPHPLTTMNIKAAAVAVIIRDVDTM